jgi:L-amino acid N-acyltransferase YncA
MCYTIKPMQPSDWEAVKSIYQQGIATGHATFETTIPDWESWDRAHLKECRLVLKTDNQVIGWAAVIPVSGRCVYGGVAEVSIYIRRDFRGRGLGKKLLQALIEESERHGIWTLQAGIFPENTASLAIHKSCEFRQVGIRQRIGKMNGVWRDVVLLERRSKSVGV